jgi:hypothetical protein
MLLQGQGRVRQLPRSLPRALLASGAASGATLVPVLHLIQFRARPGVAGERVCWKQWMVRLMHSLLGARFAPYSDVQWGREGRHRMP